MNCNELCFHLFIPSIKYYSYIYDEIIIQSTKNIDKIRNIFHYDNTKKYNIELNGLDIKKEYFFENNNYSLIDIYQIMNISEKDLLLL